MNGQIQYGRADLMTSEATARGITADSEIASRLLQFRRELRTLAAPLTRTDLQRLVEMARELHLRDESIGEELAEIRALYEALDLADQLARGDLPVVVSFGRLPQGECCHFVTPVRFGRRRSDQFGHLELTSGWLKFHGALDISIVWTEVASVQRCDHHIVASLADSARSLRFCCHSLSEAARGSVVASYLVSVAQQVRLSPPPS